MIELTKQILNKLIVPYSIDANYLSIIGGGREDSDGIVYKLENEGSLQALKIMAWEQGNEQQDKKFEERLHFIEYAQEKGVAVAAPLKDIEGKLYRTFLQDNVKYITYLMPYIEGVKKEPDEWDASFLKQWGRLIGKMHKISESYGEKYKQSDIINWNVEWEELNNQQYDKEVQSVWYSLREVIKTFPKDNKVYGIIHNDPHYQNILKCKEQLYLIDFDVATWHWYMNDIAIALQSIMLTTSGGMGEPLTNVELLKKFLNNFLEGYAIERTLEDTWLERLDIFIQYRRIHLFVLLEGLMKSNSTLYKIWKDQILEQPEYIKKILI